MNGTRPTGGPEVPDNLFIVCSSQGVAVELSLHGELDLANVARLDDAVSLAVGSGAGRLLIDIGPLSFVDVAGVRALLAARDMCLAAGMRCRVAGRPSPQVMRTLWLVQADTRLGFPRRDPLAFIAGERGRSHTEGDA